MYAITVGFKRNRSGLLLVNLSNASERLIHFPVEEELSYEVANVSLYEKQYPNVSRTTNYFLKRLPFDKQHPLDALFKETIFNYSECFINKFLLKFYFIHLLIRYKKIG